MEHRASRKALWLSLAAIALALSVLLVGMSLASAQTATPAAAVSATTALGGTASATTALGGTASATSALGGTASATTAAGGTVSPLSTSTVGTVSPLRTSTVTAFGTPTVSSTAAASTTLRLTLPQRSYLTLDLALKAANAALIKCTQGGYTVTVTVVDSEGLQKVVLSQDGANPATLNGSYRKAFTAASLNGATSALTDRVASNPAQAGLARLDDRILLLAGGVPISANNQLVGGIGVSGAPSGTLDEDCARAGIDSLR